MKTEIPAKNLKGDDGYVTFSVRIKNSVVASLDEKTRESGPREIMSSARFSKLAWRRWSS